MAAKKKAKTKKPTKKELAAKKKAAQLEKEKKKRAIEAAKKKLERERQKKKEGILRQYANLAKKLKRKIGINDMVDIGVSKDTITHYFRSLSRLEEAAREKYDTRFHDVAINEIMGPKALKKLSTSVSKFNRFFVTTAITGCQVDKNFLKSAVSFCKLNKAQLLVLVASDPAHNRSGFKEGEYLGSIDKDILHSGVVVTADTALNSNLYISTIKLSAKHIDPITGLDRIGQKNGSFIYASPKQRLRAVAVSNEKLPHVLMTTGAITKPNYNTKNYMSERTGYIANNDHVMGGLIVEIENDEIFHYRQVQANKSGSFIDFGIQYKKDGTTKAMAPEALVMGDWHSGSTDPTAKAAWFDIVEKLKCKRLVVHDGFDGFAINHHERENRIIRALRAMEGRDNLKKEIEEYAQDLREMSELVDEVVLVKSNHDDFLDRWLMTGKYTDDPVNHRYALDVAAAMLDGYDPLKWAIEQTEIVENDNLTWLERDDDYLIAGIQLGAHGDKGSNGARGSLMAMERSYGNSVTGHTHSPEILRGAWQVGTTSLLKLSYNEGPSSWFHTSCLVYSNGSRQLINSVEGNYRCTKNAHKIKA